MPDEFSISGGGLRAVLTPEGAALRSLTAADGTEYLWQGDPRYWAGRFFHIFPFVGRAWEGRCTDGGRAFEMPTHGFAGRMRFTRTERRADSAAFLLESCAETLALYPHPFRLRISYQAEGALLRVSCALENTGARTMHFDLGCHPGFRVPLESGRAFSDYRVLFPKAKRVRCADMSDDCFFLGGFSDFPLEEGGALPLRHGLFDRDAVILRDTGGEALLAPATGGRGLRLRYPDAEYLVLWHTPRTDAPFLCMEPCSGLPARRGVIEALETKPSALHLAPGGTYRVAWELELTVT